MGTRTIEVLEEGCLMGRMNKFTLLRTGIFVFYYPEPSES